MPVGSVRGVIVVAALFASAGPCAGGGGDFAEAPTCPFCPEAPEAITIADDAFAGAGIEVWRCPECGRYYWSGAWHDAASFAAEAERLRRQGKALPRACPFCGGTLHPTTLYVMETAEGDKPAYLCGTCFAVVMPDGKALTAAEVRALEASRSKEHEKTRAAELARKYGWPPAKAKRVAAGEVEVGDEAKAVREAWGPPASVERDMSPKGGIQERWYYADGRLVSLRDGVVTAVDETPASP